MASVQSIDSLIESSLGALAADSLVTRWRAKETNWVSYFAFRHLLQCGQPGGIISDPAQIGIEVSVPQPPGYIRRGVHRDLVIWPAAGMTCWDDKWMPLCHPLAILEWKVHRPGHKNPDVDHERKWLRAYCRWQPSVVGYAIEVDGTRNPTTITCSRFLGSEEKTRWLEFQCE